MRVKPRHWVDGFGAHKTACGKPVTDNVRITDNDAHIECKSCRKSHFNPVGEHKKV